MTQSPPLFRLQNVTKRFGSVVANKDVTFAAYPSRIHALLGENGAGKSALMSILSGRYQPDAAEMVLHNLQIIPHSELGAITNYMRGGIIVKFNLEFPYDADIDKIRKVIKKVGKAMLADEELGKDFIKPVKSQGVREIANSVMVIRVKFTANPGAHFVIRREAYKRITEALNKKGIYYSAEKNQTLAGQRNPTKSSASSAQTRKKSPTRRLPRHRHCLTRFPTAEVPSVG